MCDDDWLEGLLKQQRPDSAPDDGFSDRLLARLPARRPTHRWIVPVLSLAGAVQAAVLMRHSDVLEAPAAMLTAAQLSKTHLIEIGKSQLIDTPAAAVLQYPGLIVLTLAVCVAWIACAWALIATKADG